MDNVKVGVSEELRVLYRTVTYMRKYINDIGDYKQCIILKIQNNLLIVAITTVTSYARQRLPGKKHNTSHTMYTVPLEVST